MSRHDHHTPEDAIPVSALGLDEFETELLSILRHFLTAFTRPETQAWQTAFSIATERWGMARGPQVAQGLLAVIHAMRQARQSDFHYSNPLCVSCRTMATDEEAAFCMMIHAMRRDRPDLARGAIYDLAEGVMDPVLIESALAFAARFPADAAARHHGGENRMTRPSAMTKPNLRLVH